MFAKYNVFTIISATAAVLYHNGNLMNRESMSLSFPALGRASIIDPHKFHVTQSVFKTERINFSACLVFVLLVFSSRAINPHTKSWNSAETDGQLLQQLRA